MKQLFIKEIKILKKNIELTFNKDFKWIYIETEKPIIKYILKNCENIDIVNLEDVDSYNDGITIEISRNKQKYIFETTDMGNRKTTIICEEVEVIEMEYQFDDLKNIIIEISKQLEIESASNTKYSNRENNLKKYITKEIEINERKLKEASWLTNNKKKYIEGQQNVLEKIVEILNSKLK